MPVGTSVHKCVQDVKAKQGGSDKSPSNAYAVCQSSTGQNFHTGQPIDKHAEPGELLGKGLYEGVGGATRLAGAGIRGVANVAHAVGSGVGTVGKKIQSLTPQGHTAVHPANVVGGAVRAIGAGVRGVADAAHLAGRAVGAAGRGIYNIGRDMSEISKAQAAMKRPTRFKLVKKHAEGNPYDDGAGGDFSPVTPYTPPATPPVSTPLSSPGLGSAGSGINTPLSMYTVPTAISPASVKPGPPPAGFSEAMPTKPTAKPATTLDAIRDNMRKIQDVERALVQKHDRDVRDQEVDTFCQETKKPGPCKGQKKGVSQGAKKNPLESAKAEMDRLHGIHQKILKLHPTGGGVSGRALREGSRAAFEGARDHYTKLLGQTMKKKPAANKLRRIASATAGGISGGIVGAASGLGAGVREGLRHLKHGFDHAAAGVGAPVIGPITGLVHGAIEGANRGAKSKVSPVAKKSYRAAVKAIRDNPSRVGGALIGAALTGGSPFGAGVGLGLTDAPGKPGWPKKPNKHAEGNWLQGAIKHPGRCTPLNSPSCTGHARALAVRLKRGDLHEDNKNK